MKARLPSEIMLTPTHCKTGMNWRISPFSVTLSDFRRIKIDTLIMYKPLRDDEMFIAF